MLAHYFNERFIVVRSRNKQPTFIEVGTKCHVLADKPSITYSEFIEPKKVTFSLETRMNRVYCFVSCGLFFEICLRTVSGFWFLKSLLNSSFVSCRFSLKR